MCDRQVDAEIRLKRLMEADAAPLFRLVDASRARLSVWLRWVDRQADVSDTLAFIRAAEADFARGAGFQSGIWYRSELAGCIGLHALEPGSATGSLGYWLADPYRGRGIMTRAVRVAAACAFTTYGLEAVEIRAAAENYASRAVAERAGFREEGHVPLSGETGPDYVVYRLAAAEWSPD